MEKKQTAVEWLDRWFRDNPEATYEEGNKALQQAKEMEKQQIIEFAKGFWYYGNGADAPPCYNEDVEKYYNKQYER